MLTSNVYTCIFSYLELREILERLFLVNKKFIYLSKIALTQKTSAELQEKNYHELSNIYQIFLRLNFIVNLILILVYLIKKFII